MDNKFPQSKKNAFRMQSNDQMSPEALAEDGRETAPQQPLPGSTLGKVNYRFLLFYCEMQTGLCNY